ncbi:hypothetical protein BC834DRAFT_972298 [Gloeopeniophorella convolvens]|nr:hypothetical protein BC834DRAFT_972298 [Gloeopeniophorella convolvens]
MDAAVPSGDSAPFMPGGTCASVVSKIGSAPSPPRALPIPTELRKAIAAGPLSETTRTIAAIDKEPGQRASTFTSASALSRVLTLHETTRTAGTQYRAPWKLPGNKRFATGTSDRVIKIWSLASGELRPSLTGYISTVRGLAVSSRYPYVFLCSEDKIGQVLGPRGEQGHPALPRSPLGRARAQPAPDAGHPRYVGPRCVGARVAQTQVLSGHIGATVAGVRCRDLDPQAPRARGA